MPPRPRSASVIPPRAGDQVGAPLGRPGERRGPSPRRHPAVVPRAQHVRAPPIRGTRPAACTAGTPTTPTRTTRRRPTCRCPSPPGPAARPPRAPPSLPPLPRPAPRRRPRARRRPDAPAPGRRRPRSDRTARRSRRAPASSPASDWSRRRPPGPSRNSGRGGCTRSTVSNTGPGINTMPAPPPKGASSTVRCGVARRVPQIVHPDVEHRTLAGPTEQALVGERVDHLREDGDDVDAHVRPVRLRDPLPTRRDRSVRRGHPARRRG